MCAFFAIAITLVLIGPVAASAADVERSEVAATEALMPSNEALFCARGNQLSSGLKQALTARNMAIDDNTLIEFVAVGDNAATAIIATNVMGQQITKNALMAINENGDFQSLTNAQIAALTSNLSGGNATVDPFDDSFEIVFMASFYAYAYGGWSLGLAQPQTAMFIYYDNSNLYDVNSISMTYGCSGVEGYYTNGNFQAITDPLGFFRYDINVYRVNPNPRTYYSTTDPFPSNKAIMLNSGQGGAHFVEYSIDAIRQRDNKRIVIENYIFLDLG